MAAFSQRVVSVTQDYIVPKIFDTILSDSLVTLRFIGNGKEWSGETYKVPVKVDKSRQGTSFSGLEQFSTNLTDDRITLSYDLRAYAMPVVISGLEKLVNQKDSTRVVNLVKTEMESRADDMIDDVSEIFYGDGTGNGSREFLGLDVLIDDGTTSTLIGGQSRTTYPTLKGTRTASGGTLTLFKMASLYTSISSGSAGRNAPTLFDTDETTWNLYESLLSPTVVANYSTNGYPKVTRNSKAPIAAGELRGAMGMTSLLYKGVPMVADEKAPTGTLWGINENFIEWLGAMDSDMQKATFNNDTIDGVYSDMPTNDTGLQFSGLMKSPNQYGEAGFLYLFGNLVTKNPKRQGRITGITGV